MIVETESSASQVGLALATEPRLILNSWCSCPCFLNAGITSISQQARVFYLFVCLHVGHQDSTSGATYLGSNDTVFFCFVLFFEQRLFPELKRVTPAHSHNAHHSGQRHFITYPLDLAISCHKVLWGVPGRQESITKVQRDWITDCSIHSGHTLRINK